MRRRIRSRASDGNRQRAGWPQGIAPPGPPRSRICGGPGWATTQVYPARITPLPGIAGAGQGQVYRLGLSPRRRPAERLSADEWWVRDLADELGVSYCRFKCWVEKGYVHVRKVGGRGNLVIWADAEDRERPGRLRDYLRPGRSNHYPVELTRPEARSDQECNRKARPAREEKHEQADR